MKKRTLKNTTAKVTVHFTVCTFQSVIFAAFARDIVPVTFSFPSVPSGLQQKKGAANHHQNRMFFPLGKQI